MSTEGNYSNISPDKFLETIHNVNLNDPAQFAAAVSILSKMTDSPEKPTSAPDTSSTATSSMLAETSPTCKDC